MLRISQIKLNIDESVSLLPKKIGQKLRIRNFRPDSWKIVKESVDAREKPHIRFIYTVDFQVKDEEKLLHRAASIKGVTLTKAPDDVYEIPDFSSTKLEEEERPVIVGFGPCGMFAALILAEAGLRPVVLERGRDADRRARDVEHFWSTGELDTESNVQFGEGGAGTFSDGKLTTGIRDARITKVKEELILAGADPAVAYRQMPHVGTDVLRNVVKNIRKKIISLGGDVIFESRLTGIEMENNVKKGAQGGTEKKKRLSALRINGSESRTCRRAVIAPGNSARDTFRMLSDRKIAMEAKPFSVGVRIEHPQTMIDTAQYGMEPNDTEGRLGAASYKLSHHTASGRGVYTFCMCPGGYVVGAASREGGVVTNGMSYHDRKGRNANSAVLADVRPEDFPDIATNPLAGMDFQEKLEQAAFAAGGGSYFAPVQRVGDFLQDRESRTPKPEEEKDLPVTPTYRPGVRWGSVTECLPDYVTDALREALPQMGRRIRGFDMEDAVMTGVETRSSSPVRILRDADLESVSVSGLYPGGEGAGYAGGIMSAAVDGIRIAEKIMEAVGRECRWSGDDPESGDDSGR